MKTATLLLLAACLVAGEPKINAAPAANIDPIPQLDGVTIDNLPYRFMTDVGATAAERKAFGQRILGPIMGTTEFFKNIYGLKPTVWEDFLKIFKGSKQKPEPLIRFMVWQERPKFLEYFQRRLATKTIPGAYWYYGGDYDVYGKRIDDTFIREIGLCADEGSDEQLLREAYHELGHAFMFTFMNNFSEVPSWLEEGTAQLFQYRVGNGTKPEAERLQRQGWLTEILFEGTSVPWTEFTRVKNIDNLDFTWKDPLRSELQYLQAWSSTEFMIATPERANAYTKLIWGMKDAMNKKLATAANDAEYRKIQQNYLYEVQDELFQKLYGAELLKVEGLWKDWVNKSYETILKTKPAIRYHRGEWAMLRARFAKGDDRTARFARAEALFQECIDKNADQPEGYVGMGRLALERGTPNLAWDFFATAVAKGSTNSEAMLYGGITFIMRGKPEEAIKPLTKVLVERPAAYGSNFWLGIALTAGKGDNGKAAKNFAIAGAADKGRQGECTFWEGIAHLMGGRGKQARLSFTRAMGQPGAPPESIAWLAMARAVEGDRQTAIDTLEKAGDNPVAVALRERLGSGKDLPGMVFSERSQPGLDVAANYTPIVPPKAPVSNNPFKKQE